VPDDADPSNENLPPGPILPPADRHYINRITRRTPAADLTTLIPPSLDVAGDLAAIRAGQAKREGDRYTVNNRVYQRHESGRVFPLEGEGLVGPVTRGVMHALNAYARYTGINERAEYEISMKKGITVEERDEARRIWRMRDTER
jgi:hypothetical protein